jgi:hypothetical protein
MTRLLLCVLALGAVSACGSEPDEPRGKGRLTLRQGSSLEGLPECGVDLPVCPAENRNCVIISLNGVKQARCVDSSILCTEYLTCTGGTECAIVETLPEQAVCLGNCQGPDCDKPVSNSGP